MSVIKKKPRPKLAVVKPEACMMTEAEARISVERIRYSIESVRTEILDLHERRGWEALGYKSWRACVTAEFPEMGQSRLYQELTAARVERNLSTIVEMDGSLPESHARELAKLKEPERQVEAYREALALSDGEPTAKVVKDVVRRLGGDAPSEDSDSWYTPSSIVEMARTVMGAIDCDPASSDEAQRTVKASTYYTADNCGLEEDHEWHGRVFLNPPYSKGNIALFIRKLIRELDAGRTTEAVVIVNSATDTGWFHALAPRAHLCMHRGRIPFKHPGNDGDTTGRSSSIIFYVGPNVSRFAQTFSDVGLVWGPPVALATAEAAE